MYFKNMSNIVYPIGEKSVIAKDIFKRVGSKRPQLNKIGLISYYIEDGDTPEIVAKKIYNNVFYHWTILIVNDIVNPYEEWPKNERTLLEYVKDKYGVDNVYNNYHYVLTSSMVKKVIDADSEYTMEQTHTVVDYDAAKIASGEYTAISNYDYELRLNDDKRQIFLINNNYMPEFVSQYNKLMAK